VILGLRKQAFFFGRKLPSCPHIAGGRTNRHRRQAIRLRANAAQVGARIHTTRNSARNNDRIKYAPVTLASIVLPYLASSI
jgi:hypothetical protein